MFPYIIFQDGFAFARYTKVSKAMAITYSCWELALCLTLGSLLVASQVEAETERVVQLHGSGTTNVSLGCL